MSSLLARRNVVVQLQKLESPKAVPALVLASSLALGPDDVRDFGLDGVEVLAVVPDSLLFVQTRQWRRPGIAPASSSWSRSPERVRCGRDRRWPFTWLTNDGACNSGSRL